MVLLGLSKCVWAQCALPKKAWDCFTAASVLETSEPVCRAPARTGENIPRPLPALSTMAWMLYVTRHTASVCVCLCVFFLFFFFCGGF